MSDRSEQRLDPWSDSLSEEAFAAVLPPDFTAFYALHHRPYLLYACAQLGTRADAEWVVEEVFGQLASCWTEVLRQPNVAAYALATLKEETAKVLAARGRPLALVETAAFADVRAGTRDRLLRLESDLGLYSAITRLPDRQYDVVVLRYVLGYPVRQVAEIMGLTPATVRSHVRGARRRLARELGIAWTVDEEE
ncbi:RNA polymerase sigma factor [Streptomyces mobaraensis]|uniref:RNA polymerase sigma factor n=1 Tax=Streptomyces mobaraensis TaxID=35621 RepID=UPI0013DFD446|nr:sigma-70 family RNA polymerase sigma factor [Streptomyces mobaraensis]